MRTIPFPLLPPPPHKVELIPSFVRSMRAMVKPSLDRYMVNFGQMGVCMPISKGGAGCAPHRVATCAVVWRGSPCMMSKPARQKPPHPFLRLHRKARAVVHHKHCKAHQPVVYYLLALLMTAIRHFCGRTLENSPSNLSKLTCCLRRRRKNIDIRYF